MRQSPDCFKGREEAENEELGCNEAQDDNVGVVQGDPRAVLQFVGNARAKQAEEYEVCDCARTTTGQDCRNCECYDKESN